MVDWRKRDQYGRVIAKVLISGEDVCLHQVEAGLALQAVSVRADASEPAVSRKG